MDLLEVVRLLTRVMNDPLPRSGVDAIYLFSETADNESSVLEAAAELTRIFPDAELCLSGTDPWEGYPGHEAWTETLVRAGVRKDRIRQIKAVGSQRLNTRSESQALITFSRKNGYRSLLVIAAPFHQLRAFMTVVTVTLESYPGLRIYSRPGTPLPWLDQAVHSQGTLKATRDELIDSELERIERYQRQDDLGSFSDVLHYLEAREQR